MSEIKAIYEAQRYDSGEILVGLTRQTVISFLNYLESNGFLKSSSMENISGHFMHLDSIIEDFKKTHRQETLNWLLSIRSSIDRTVKELE